MRKAAPWAANVTSPAALHCIVDQYLNVISPTLPAGYFTFWVILSMTWGLIAAVIATLLPIWESRAALTNMCYHLVGKGSKIPSTGEPSPVPVDDFKPASKDVQMGTPAVNDDSAHAFRV